MPDEPKRIHSLDFLRGVASLAVCWFHLTRYQFQTPDGAAYEAVRAAGAHGWLGVEVFFVISGFVIPHSLGRAGYRLRDYPRFLLKRVVRLDPPYLAALYRRRSAVTDFFGQISYSLYLLHWPVGHVALSLLGAKAVGDSTDAHKLLVLALSLGASFAAAYLLFLLVERPSQRWSARIRYGRAGPDPRPAETSGLAPAET